MKRIDLITTVTSNETRGHNALKNTLHDLASRTPLHDQNRMRMCVCLEPISNQLQTHHSTQQQLHTIKSRL